MRAREETAARWLGRSREQTLLLGAPCDHPPYAKLSEAPWQRAWGDQLPRRVADVPSERRSSMTLGPSMLARRGEDAQTFATHAIQGPSEMMSRHPGTRDSATHEGCRL